MKFSQGRRQNKNKVKSVSFRLFSEKVGMFLKPAKLNRKAMDESERIGLDTIVVVDMSSEQPLVEAFRHVKHMSQRGQVKANILVTKVHSEVQARSVYSKLTSLCENFLNVQLQYLGGVPCETVLKNLPVEEKVKKAPANDGSRLYHPKAQSHLDFIQEYWIQTHPLMAVCKKDVKNA